MLTGIAVDSLAIVRLQNWFVFFTVMLKIPHCTLQILTNVSAIRPSVDRMQHVKISLQHTVANVLKDSK